MAKIIGHFVLGKNVGQFGEDQGTSDFQLFQYPDGQGQNVPSHSPGQSGVFQIILSWENLEFRSYIIYVILQGPQISYHIRAKWTRVSPV